MPNRFLHSIFLSLFSIVSFCQVENDSISEAIPKGFVVTDTINTAPIDALSPARAAFYSAILPGLGQVYNKKYWKVPIAVGGIAAGIYFFKRNDKQYNRYRDAYKRRLAGFDNDEFPNVTTDGLRRAQKTLKQNKELSLLITFGIYALNIIDANVDAHLLQYNVDENLSLAPHFQYNDKERSSDLGLTLNYKF